MRQKFGSWTKSSKQMHQIRQMKIHVQHSDRWTKSLADGLYKRQTEPKSAAYGAIVRQMEPKVRHGRWSQSSSDIIRRMEPKVRWMEPKVRQTVVCKEVEALRILMDSPWNSPLPSTTSTLSALSTLSLSYCPCQ